MSDNATATAVAAPSPLLTMKDGQRLVIEGNTISLMSEVKEKTVKLSEFMSQLAKAQPFHSGYLPKDCAFMERSTHRGVVKTVYVIEWIPDIIRVKYRGIDGGDNNDTNWGTVVRDFELSWPGSVWVIKTAGETVNEVRLAAIHEPTYRKGYETPLFLMPMPNQYDYQKGAFCTGQMTVPEQGCVGFKINDLLRNMTTSEWNQDLIPQYARYGITGLKDWHARTKENPEAWKTLKWRQHVFPTLGHIVKHMLGGGNTEPENDEQRGN